MKAIVRSSYGSPDVLELRDIAKPVVKDDEVLVRVRASSVNTADIDFLRGRPTFARITPGLYGLRAPTNRVLGLNVAGQVEAVGKDVTEFRPGDEVFGDLTQHGFGAFAEYAAAPERAFAKQPAGMTFEEFGHPSARRLSWHFRVCGAGARSSPVTGCSSTARREAWAHSLCRSPKRLVRGDWRVQHRQERDGPRCGADHVIDYTQEDFTRSSQRYDPMIDIAGTRSIFACRRALRPNGTYLWVGGSTARLLQAVLRGPLISLVGNRKMGMLPWKPFPKADVVFLEELIAGGTVRPVIDRRYPLAEVPDALRYLGGRTRSWEDRHRDVRRPRRLMSSLGAVVGLPA